METRLKKSGGCLGIQTVTAQAAVGPGRVVPPGAKSAAHPPSDLGLGPLSWRVQPHTNTLAVGCKATSQPSHSLCTRGNGPRVFFFAPAKDAPKIFPAKDFLQLGWTWPVPGVPWTETGETKLLGTFSQLDRSLPGPGDAASPARLSRRSFALSILR